MGGSGAVASLISNLGPNALIYGYVAVYAGQNATVTNRGTLEATQVFGGNAPQDAVIFGGGTNRLIIDPGAVFIGNVVGSGPATLAPGGNTIVAGTANGIGNHYDGVGLRRVRRHIERARHEIYRVQRRHDRFWRTVDVRAAATRWPAASG